MKTHVYNCDSTRVAAQAARREHIMQYPNGLACYNKKSNRVPYTQLGYVIYETKTQIVVSELGDKL